MARLEVQLLALFGSKLANVASVADCGMRIGADGLAAVVMTRADLSHSQVWVELAAKRKHGFALERAVFLTVLHRIFISGSDGAADRWRDDCAIADVDGLELHHLYRAMAWLGEELPDKDQDGRTPFAPRCTKDIIEEQLFAYRRDLFTRVDLVFMDTTSLYFEGAGGQTLDRHGFSKDHRPDLRQMIHAVLIDGDGHPVCSEMWPGNTADVTTLIPVINRLRGRFAIRRVCIVADRGMISAETLAELESRELLYILGVRERTDKIVRELVLDDPAPLVPLMIDKSGKQVDYEAKAVTLAGRRYIVCRNHQEARKDAADRASIVAALQRQLAKGRQGASRQYWLPPVPQDHKQRPLRHRSGQGRARRKVRWHLRAAHQH
jgi:hypothetical protein